jgi:Zn-finger nucleic acid-binding protein
MLYSLRMTFRDQRPQCPVCPDRALVPQSELRAGLAFGNATRLVCEQCRGVLVSAVEVEAMIADLQYESFTLPAGQPGTRTCPRCTATMTVLALFDIEVDRCEQHGVWFDGKELAMVLESASVVDPRTIADGSHAKTTFGKLKAWLSPRKYTPTSPRRPDDT